MQHHLILPALSTIALMISACNKMPEAPVAPNAATEAWKLEPSNSAGSSTGVPSAESVFPAATTAPPVPLAGRTNGVMTPAQESRGMPMPGQNNDHSAPLDSTKSASSP